MYCVHRLGIFTYLQNVTVCGIVKGITLFIKELYKTPFKLIF